MTHGRKVCNTLKEIRRQIADKNEIEYATDDCHFEGECKGTCPKCDAEVKYLENELHKRKLLGKTAAIAGISLGIAGTFSACNAPQQKSNTTTSKQEIAADTVNLDTIPIDTIPVIPRYITGNVDDINTVDGLIAPDWDDVYIITETLPEYPGGDEARIKFMKENLVYPREAIEKR